MAAANVCPNPDLLIHSIPRLRLSRHSHNSHLVLDCSELRNIGVGDDLGLNLSKSRTLDCSADLVPPQKISVLDGIS